MAGRLSGKRAFITAAGQGIGAGWDAAVSAASTARVARSAGTFRTVRRKKNHH